MREVEILVSKAIKFNCIINEFKNGTNILRDKTLLESAISNVYQTMFGEDLYKSDEERAYMLFVNIARNHPFIDGNKRSACLICDYFLMEHDLELDIDNSDKFKLMINIIEKNIELETGLTIFKSLIKPIESIKRNHINEELKEVFIKEYEQLKLILEDMNSVEDESELIVNNFMKSFSEKHHINYSDLKDIYELELKNNKEMEMV